MQIPPNIEAFAQEREVARKTFQMEEELKQLANDPLNLEIMAKFQCAHDAAMDAHMARKVSSLKEAIDPLLEVVGLVPTDPFLGRDFLTGRDT